MKLDGTWDVAVIGAGPSGGVAAAILAERGRRVLLIERSVWPREKVCGGCLNAAAVLDLKKLGMGVALMGARAVDQARWVIGDERFNKGPRFSNVGKTPTLALPRGTRGGEKDGRIARSGIANGCLVLAAPGGAAILRSEMDAAIVAQAVARGCVFVSGVSATLLPADSSAAHRFIQLKDADSTFTVATGAVLACDGIGGTLLSGEKWARWRISRGAWMGVATTCGDWPDDLEAGTIHMHVGHGGYVGLVRLADERVHLAAALDPGVCRGAGGPANLIEKILGFCGREVWGGLAAARFRGTGELTRRRDCVGGRRVLAVGDACGYVEPFTGEGMAWAIAGARQAAELLLANGKKWPDNLADQWQRLHDATIVRRQRWCRRLRPMMHHPALAAAGAALGRAAPAVGSFIASRIQGGVA